MQKHEFKQLFLKALEEAAAYADECLGKSVARDFEIEFHRAGHSGSVLSPEEAFDLMYISEDRFYKIIDVAVIDVQPNKTRVFICLSGHSPGAFEETWNQPPGVGPFKQLRAAQIHTSNTL